MTEGAADEDTDGEIDSWTLAEQGRTPGAANHASVTAATDGHCARTAWLPATAARRRGHLRYLYGIASEK